MAEVCDQGIGRRPLELNNFGMRTKSGDVAVAANFQSRLFEGLTAAERHTFLEAARQRKLSDNQVLQHEGEPGNHLSMVISGLAGLYKITPKGRKLFVRWIAPGDVFGLVAMQRDVRSYLTTVHALRAGSVLVWERGALNDLTHQIPRVRENALAIATDHFAHVLEVLVVRASQAAHQRLAQILIEIARQIGRLENNGLDVVATNEQLADMADVSLFTVSRHLSDWQRHGILAKRRGRIRLLDMEGLIALLR